MGKFKVEIDKSTCNGFGACVELCMDFFQLSEVDGKSTIKGAKRVMKAKEVVAEVIELDELECIRKAAEACPFNAIHITDLKTEEPLI